MRSREPLKQNPDGRYFTHLESAVPNESGNRPRIYLKTTDKSVAKRRLSALQYLTTIESARQRVEQLVRAESPEAEQRLIEQLIFNDLESRRLDWSDLDRQTDEQGRAILGTGLPIAPAPEPGVIVDTMAEATDELARAGRLDLLQQHHQRIGKMLETAANGPAVPLPRGSQQKLSDCAREWSEWARGKGRDRDHIATYVNQFEKFVGLVGDMPINHLDKRHFVEWETHCDNLHASGMWSGKTRNDYLKAVRAVLRRARKRMPDGLFPEALATWTEFDIAEHKPDPANRQPTPIDVFHNLTAKADQLAAIDPAKYAAAMPTKGANPSLARRNNIRQAMRIKRRGTILAAVLRLCANVGADPIDCCRLKWSNLRFDGPLPLFDMPRRKAKQKITPTGGPRARVPWTCSPPRSSPEHEPQPYERALRMRIDFAGQNQHRTDPGVQNLAGIFARRCDSCKGENYVFLSAGGRKQPVANLVTFPTAAGPSAAQTQTRRTFAGVPAS